MGKGFSLSEINNFSEEEKIQYLKGLPGFTGDSIVKDLIPKDPGASNDTVNFLKNFGSTPASIPKDPSEMNWPEIKEEPHIGFFGGLAAEAEIASTLGKKGLDTIMGPITAGAHAVFGTPNINEYSPEQKAQYEYYKAGGATVPTFDNEGYITPSKENANERSWELITQMTPFQKGDLSVRESLRELANIQEAKPLGQQLLEGILVPSTLVGGKLLWGGNQLKHISQMAAPLGKSVVKQIYDNLIEDIPESIKSNDALYGFIKSSRVELLNKISNRSIDIDNVEPNSLYENDVRMWLNMKPDEILDTKNILNTLKDDLPDAEIVVNDIKNSLTRLVDLGFIKQTSADTYIKQLDDGSEEAMNILQNHTRKIAKEEPLNDYIYGLRPVQEYVDDINGIENGLIQNLLKYSRIYRIDPSMLASKPMAKAVIAHVRQLQDIDSIVETILQVGLDSRTKAFMGSLPIDINKYGIVTTTKVTEAGRTFFKNLSLLEDPDAVMIGEQKVVDTGTHWLDVFSDPGAFADDLTEEGKAFIREYAKIETEMVNLLKSYDIDILDDNVIKDGMNIIFRQVKSIGQRDILKESSPFIRRVYDTATRGMLGQYDPVTKTYSKGVDYFNSPKATLRAFLSTAYEMVAEQELNEFLIRNNLITPVSFEKAFEILNPDVLKASREAAATFLDAKINYRTVFNKFKGLENVPASGKRELKEAKKRLANAKQTMDEVSKQRLKLIDDIRNGAVRGKEGLGRVSKSVFGDKGSGKIDVMVWRDQLVKYAELGEIKEGVEKIMGPTGRWTRYGANVANTKKQIMATADASAGFTHGLFWLFDKPAMWTKAFGYSLAALADPTVAVTFMTKKKDTILEMNNYGVGIGNIELFEGVTTGRILNPLDLIPDESSIIKTKLGSVNVKGTDIIQTIFEGTGNFKSGVGGVGGNVMRRFQASYAAFLGIMKIQLWEGLKPAWELSNRPGSTPEELARFINNGTGGLDTAALGVTSGQRSIEATFGFFAPRLIRSVLTSLKDAITFIPSETIGVVTGKGFQTASERQMQSFKHVTKALSGISMFVAATHIAHGMLKDLPLQQIKNNVQEAIDPLSGSQFWNLPVLAGQYVGAGGPARAIMPILAWTASAFRPGGVKIQDLYSIDPEENQILDFLLDRTSTAPGTDIARTIIEGVTFGNIDAKPFSDLSGPLDIFPELAYGLPPFILQGQMDGDNEVGFIAGGGGLRTGPLSPSQAKRAKLENIWYSLPTEKLYEFTGEKPNSILSLLPDAHPNTAGVFGGIGQSIKDQIDRPDFPATISELPYDFIQYARTLDPELERIEQEAIDLGDERGWQSSEYKQEKLDARNEMNQVIQETHQQYGFGSFLRDTISRQLQLYGEKLNAIDSDSKYQDLLIEYEEREIVNEFNQDVDRYFDEMYKDGLYDQAGNYDTRERKRREETLVSEFGEERYERIETYIENNVTGIAKEVRLDLDMLEPYFSITEEVLEKYNFTDKYRDVYLKHPDERNLFRDGAVSEKLWTDEDSDILIDVLSDIAEQQEDMDYDSPIISALRWKHGFTSEPSNDEAFEWVEEIKAQIGSDFVDNNRGLIQAYIDRYIAELR